MGLVYLLEMCHPRIVIGTINYKVQGVCGGRSPNEDMGYDHGKLIHSFIHSSIDHCIDLVLELLSIFLPRRPPISKCQENVI